MAEPARLEAWRTHAVVLAGFLAISLVSMWPLLSSPTTLRPDLASGRQLLDADFFLIVWALSWGTHALGTDPLSLFEANSFHPSPASLAFSEHFVGYLPIFAPAYALSDNPILATNVTLVLIPLLRAGAMYSLALRFCPVPAAVVAGFLFGFFGQSVRANPMHLHATGFLYVPLALLFTERWLDRARVGDALGVAVCLFLQAATSFYLGYGAMIAYGTYLPFALAGWRARLDRRRVLGLALAGVAAVLAMVPLALPYLSLRAEGIIPATQDAVGLVPHYARQYVVRYLTENGWALTGLPLAVLGLLPVARARSAHLRAAGVALLVVGLLLAHGPWLPVGRALVWSPYQLLQDHVPGFSSVRVSHRFRVIAHLGVCLLAGFGFARLTGRWRRWPAWSAALVVVIAGSSFGLFRGFPTTAVAVGPEAPPAYLWLRAHGEEKPLLEWPMGSPRVEANRMFQSVHHWLPLVNGYSAYPFGSKAFVARLAGRLRSGEQVQNVIDHVDLGWVLVHTDEMQPIQRDRWKGPPPPGLELVHVWGGDRLYRVTAEPEEDRRGILFSATHTIEGHEKRDVTVDPCPGRLEVDPPSEAWWPMRWARLDVGARNQGSRTWPARSLRRAGLVELRWCWVGQCEDPGRVALERDVGPGEVGLARLRLRPPLRIGDAALRLWLEQSPGRSLESCGVEAVEVPVTLRMGKPDAGT